MLSNYPDLIWDAAVADDENIVFNKEDINFLKGHHDLEWYESEEKTTKHKLPCKVSCSYCRTPIM